MSTVTTLHIGLDLRGVAWIDDTNVKVIEVVLDKLAHGSSAEEMQFQYPHLSLGQIYAALSYYHDHREAFDAEIESQLDEYDRLHRVRRRKPGAAAIARRRETAVSLKLYMDVHVRRAITSGLRLRDVDVLTSQEDGTARLSDDRLLDRATELQRVLFSQDRDLLVEATRRQRAGTHFAGVIYAQSASRDNWTMHR